jgi:hypothetical protein
MKIANPIRLFAVICVAVTSGFIMVMSYRLLAVLSGPGWCATALGAGKASSADGTPIKGLEACVGLLTIQLKSLANNSYIFGGVLALCLLTLIVIVIAGGHVSLDASKSGVKADIGKDVPQAVQAVADSAQQKADVIKEAASPTGGTNAQTQ